MALLCLFASAGSAQQRAPEAPKPLFGEALTGTQFKIISQPAGPRMMLGLCAGSTFSGNARGELFTPLVLQEMVQSLYRQPGLPEQLSEQTGGEFQFETTNGFSAYPAAPEHRIGLNAVFPFARRWGALAGVSRSGFTARAAFPLTVFRQDGHSTQFQQLTGDIRAEVKRLNINAALRFCPAPNAVFQPFAGIGLRYRSRSESPLWATVQSVRWHAGALSVAADWAGLAQAGISLQPRRWPLFAEIGIDAHWPFGKDGSAAAAQVTIGWKW